MRHETFKPKQLSLRSNVHLASLYLPRELWQRMSEAPPTYLPLNRLSVACSHLVSLNKPESETVSRSVVNSFLNPWTVAYQAPPSIGFSKQEYWSGLSSSGDLLQGICPTQGLNPPLHWQADSLPPVSPGKPNYN